MSTCEICAHARARGSWPDELLSRGGTHCSDQTNRRGEVVVEGCHRSWTSKAQSHCTVCHRHFGSNAAGDSHRFGDYRGGGTPVCRDPKGVDRWDTPDGPIWGGRNPAESRKRAAKMRAATGTTQRLRATEPDNVGGNT